MGVLRGGKEQMPVENLSISEANKKRQSVVRFVKGLLRESNSRPLAPEARILPLN